MTYKVFVDDNYHYMDESERHELGDFSTLDAAIAASKKIVDEYLRSAYQPGMSAPDLYRSYVSFGKDPFIVAAASNETKVLFSAWDYAKCQCDELCGPVQGLNDGS
jgi:hypothetical protein